MKKRIGFAATLAVMISATAFAQAPAATTPAATPAPAPEPTPGTGQARSGKFSLEQFESINSDAVAAKLKSISEVRQQQIEKLKSLLARPEYRQSQDQAPKVMHMLAEYYWEEGWYQYLLKRGNYEKALETFNAGTLAQKPEEPVEDYATSLALYKQIIQQYEKTYDRIHEVIYYLGKGALKEGKAKKSKTIEREGVEFLNRLVQNYPKSKFIPDALLAMAEYYFENNSLYYAKTNYEKIINNFPKASMYNYAQYKLGWVYFNLHEFESAIETFKKVVAAVSKDEGKVKGVIEFRDQALNDLVVTFAEIDDGWVHARDYFLKVLPEEAAYKKLRALGDLYVGQDKDLYAIALFRHFIEREKTTVNIPEYYKTILGLYKKTNDLPKLDEVTDEALDYFKPNGSWKTVNKANTDAVEAADALCEEHLLYIANYYHREAQRLSKMDLYKKASDKYAVYLSRFASSKNAYIVNYSYAEILYDQLKDFKAASVQYEKVIELDTKGQYVEDAALGVIYCYEELMVAGGLQERSKKGTGIEVVKVDPKKLDAPIPETDLADLEIRYVKAADQYVSLLKALLADPEVRKKHPERGEKIPEIMYIASQVLYRHGKFQDAVTRLKVLFEYDPTSKFAAYAVFTLLDCYQRLKQWPKVEEWARKLIEKRNFTVKSEKELKKIVAIAMTENASMLTEGREYDQAIKEAMRVYDYSKGDEDAQSKALFNVAALYESKKNIDLAVKTYQRVIKEYPKSEVAPDARYTIGLIYESQTDFEKASVTFEAMEEFKSLKEPDAEKEKEKHATWVTTMKNIGDSLQNAGLIREALAEYKDAAEVYAKYVKLYSENADAPKIDLRIGMMWENLEKKDSLQKAHDHYTGWLKKTYKSSGELAVEACARDGAVLKKLDKEKNRKAAVAQFEKALEIFKKIADNADAAAASKQYAAQAAFELADYMFDDFNALKIPSTVDANVLKKALTAKAEAQQKAEKAFDNVLDYKSGGWSAGALFKIGVLYWDFRNELDAVPIPDCPCPGVNAKECKIVQKAFKDGDLDTINKYAWSSEWLMIAPAFQDQYRAIIEEIMRPVETKAAKAFDRALKLAHEEKVYNQWSRQCGEYAMKVSPETYPVAGDDQVHADHAKDTLAATSFIRSLRRGNIEVKMSTEGAR